jgi:hypothetical protein
MIAINARKVIKVNLTKIESFGFGYLGALSNKERYI